MLKRSVMSLYSGTEDIQSHRARIVLAEKGINVEVIDVNSTAETAKNLAELNPYKTVPTLVDRDLVLYEPQIIMEYLDERFPHPPLLPVLPIARAKSRLMIYRIEQDWYSLANKIETGTKKEKEGARKTLMSTLASLAPVFADMPYFLSDEFSLIDCSIAPLLWRLPSYDIQLPKHAKAVIEYGKLLFKRDSFQKSLTEPERDLKEYHETVE